MLRREAVNLAQKMPNQSTIYLRLAKLFDGLNKNREKEL